MSAFSPQATVATFGADHDARRAVEDLARSGFPVERVFIVGNDLAVAQTVVGRWTWLRAMTFGVAAGVGAGLVCGLLVSIVATGTAWVPGVMAWAQLGPFSAAGSVR